MSDKITVEKFEGDNCKELESCQTWFDLSSTMENILEFGVLDNVSMPYVLFKDADGKTYEATVEIKAVKKPYCDDGENEDEIEAKILTKEIAEEFLSNPEADDPYEFTEIEDIAAKILSNFNDQLGLDGLINLSDAAARYLSKNQGGLHFSSLKKLSDSAANSLSKHKGLLDLSGLNEVTDSAVESLAKHQGGLILSGLSKLSDAAAGSLAKHQGSLDLSGLSEISDAAAESLAKHQGELDLWGLEKLSDTAAKSFSKSKGQINVDLS